MWATGLVGAGVGALHVLPSLFWWMSYATAWVALIIRAHYEHIITQRKDQ